MSHMGSEKREGETCKQNQRNKNKNTELLKIRAFDGGKVCPISQAFCLINLDYQQMVTNLYHLKGVLNTTG